MTPFHTGVSARLAGAAVAVLLAACAAGGPGGAVPDTASTAGGLATLAAGDPLPRATLPHLDGSGTLDTADLVGTPAVVNFWATWCAFCVEEMPAFERVHAELGDAVRFVGVDREDHLGRARTLAEETGVTYELVADADGSFFRAVQGRGMPTTLLVDGDGQIVYRHAGPLDAEELRALIARHLDIGAASRGA